MYTDYIFKEEHDDYIVPNIFTPEQEDEIMREFKKINMDTDTQSRWIELECWMNDITPVCIVKLNYIRRIRLDRPYLCLHNTGHTGRTIHNK